MYDMQVNEEYGKWRDTFYMLHVKNSLTNCKNRQTPSWYETSSQCILVVYFHMNVRSIVILHTHYTIYIVHIIRCRNTAKALWFQPTKIEIKCGFLTVKENINKRWHNVKMLHVYCTYIYKPINLNLLLLYSFHFIKSIQPLNIEQPAFMWFDVSTVSKRRTRMYIYWNIQEDSCSRADAHMNIYMQNVSDTFYSHRTHDIVLCK